LNSWERQNHERGRKDAAGGRLNRANLMGGPAGQTNKFVCAPVTKPTKQSRDGRDGGLH